MPALGSHWGGLSPHLIASFFAVKKGGSDDKNRIRWERDTSQPEVLAPLSEGSMDSTMNWQSPFENVGPDQKFSSLSAMLQAGGFDSILSTLQSQFPNLGLLDNAKNLAKNAEGRSNLTKLNSTQIFSGMPPVKLNVTAHFRAYADADLEVRQPLNQLMNWALPESIAPDGVLAEGARGNVKLYQSKIPQIIGMKYGDMLIMPLVIESIPYPITGPRTAGGVLTTALIALQLATLTAIDKDDWNASFAAAR